jgi:hypothetical protein
MVDTPVSVRSIIEHFYRVIILPILKKMGLALVLTGGEADPISVK